MALVRNNDRNGAVRDPKNVTLHDCHESDNQCLPHLHQFLGIQRPMPIAAAAHRFR